MICCACVLHFQHLCVFSWLQPGSGDVTYSIVSGSNAASYFGVQPTGIIFTNRDLTTDNAKSQSYTVSCLSSGVLGFTMSCTGFTL